MGSTWQKIRTKIEGTNQYNNIPKKPGNDEPGKPMGQAITSHILNPKTQAAGLFIQWIKDLFEI